MTKIEYSQWPAGVPKSLPVASHTLDDNLRAVTKVTPDKTALIFYGATKSYAQLNDEVTRVAAYLQSVCGIQKGDRVGIYMQNSVQFVAAFYGIIRAGGIVVPINPMHKKDELTYLCQDAAIRTVLTAQDIVANAASLLETGVLDHVIAAHYGSELPNGNSVDVPDIVTSGPTQYPEDVIGWSVMMTADVTFVPSNSRPKTAVFCPTHLVLRGGVRAVNTRIKQPFTGLGVFRNGLLTRATKCTWARHQCSILWACKA